MAAYLDTSVIASLFVADAHTERAASWLGGGADIAFSDWTLAEFTSVIATVVRTGRLSSSMRATAERNADLWVARRGAPLAVLADDVRDARKLINSTNEPLRAADALHLAVASRAGCSLATFDIAMRRAALALGLPIEDL